MDKRQQIKDAAIRLGALSVEIEDATDSVKVTVLVPHENMGPFRCTHYMMSNFIESAEVMLIAKILVNESIAAMKLAESGAA